MAKPLVLIVTAALIVLACNPAAAADDGLAQIDSQQLQYDFANAKDLVVEPDWHDLPDDARRLLEHVGNAFFGSKPGLANIGEDWSSLDFTMPHVPAALHVFSAYSDAVTGSLFLIGGGETKAFVLVAYRHAQDFCIFKMQAVPDVRTLRVVEIQDLVRPNRDTTIQPVPKCRPQSLRYALQLAGPWE